MNQLSQLLGEIQREAAALPTGQLRTEIQVHLDVLTALIDNFRGIRPGAVSPEEMDSARGDVFAAALITALYVRELTTRPAPRFARVRLSAN
jgi:hypothetical protein